MVVALQRASAAGARAHGAAIDDVRVVGVHHDEAAFTRARVGAVAQSDGAPLGRTGHRNRGVVLLRAVHAVRVLVVNVEAIKLRRFLVVNARPTLATVVRHAGAAVIAFNHAPGVGGVDPQVVVVTVRCRHFGEVNATIGGLPHLQIGDVDGVDLGRVSKHVGVVPGAMNQVAIGADQRPTLAVVIAAIEACLFAFGFDECVYPA